MTRRRVLRALAQGAGPALALAVLEACRGIVFACGDDEQCDGQSGESRCEATGYCSYPDPTCPTGRRYSDHAGSGLANECVGGGESGSDSASTNASMGTTATSATGTSMTTSDPTTDSATAPSTSDSVGSTGTVVDCDDGWLDCAWTKRLVITVDDLDLPGLPDFPVLVVLDGGRVDHAATDGTDLLFATPSGTRLDHDVDAWNPDGTSFVWVRLSGDATDLGTFYMYYGNDAAPAPEDGTAVWAEYAGVWHLGESTTDATANDNDGVPTNVGVAPGTVASGNAWDGSGGSITVPPSASLADVLDGGGTLSLWVRADGSGKSTTARVFDKIGAQGSVGYRLLMASPGLGGARLRFDHQFSNGGASWESNEDLLDWGSWTHVAVVYDASTQDPPTIYIDGMQRLLSTMDPPQGSGTSDAMADVVFGNNSLDDRALDGRLDEIRLHPLSRSQPWIDAERRSALDLVLGYGPTQTVQ